MGCLACTLAGRPELRTYPRPTTPCRWQGRTDNVYPPTGQGAIERVQFITPESTRNWQRPPVIINSMRSVGTQQQRVRELHERGARLGVGQRTRSGNSRCSVSRGELLRTL